MAAPTAPIDSLDVGVYRIPTDAPESDGTLEWDATTLVLVQIAAAGQRGLGYTYADRATAMVIADHFEPLLRGTDAWDIPARVGCLRRAVRNLGLPGIASMALSAVDVALWDLKAKLSGLSLCRLLGQQRADIMVYGSGGFTSYDDAQLRSQFSGWAGAGIRAVKMKVGRDAAADPARVAVAREAIGPDVALFLDANGSYTRKQALQLAQEFAALDVTWFEEPVSSDDLAGLRLIRDRAPPGMNISAGEYGYTPWYFARMLEAGAVDVLQADATRCGGVSGFLAAAALCEAACLPLSSHCAPALHVSLDCAVDRCIHLEYFHDHVRIESLLFEGAPQPRQGRLAPELARPGLGLELRTASAARYRV